MIYFVSNASQSETSDILSYEGKIFEAGDYPDKAFSISVDELRSEAEAFSGVDLDLEHSPINDLLGHKLGRLERIWLEGKSAFGRLSVPRWLHELCGGRLQTSLSFNADKQVVGCALTLNPRIPDATVIAAFSASRLPPDSPKFQKEKSPMPLTFKERLRILFHRAPDAVEEAGIDPAELDTSFPEQKTIDPEIESQLVEFRAINDRLSAGQLTTHATLFADETIREAKAIPAQRAELISLFRSAAMADGKGGIQFSETGQLAEGPNLDALRALFRNAPTHTLFTTQIPNADPNADGSTPDPARIKKLREATHLGRQTLPQEGR